MKDKNKSLIDTAAEIAESVLPEVQSVLKDAMNAGGGASTGEADTATSDAAPASADASEAIDSSSGRGRGLLALLVIGGLIAIAAVVIQRILSGKGGEDADDNWTSSYTPTAPDAETHAAATPAEVDGEAPAEASAETEESDESSA
jgi:hypothetical protein